MNQFGEIFRLSIFGESHGNCVGITIDGYPAGVSLRNVDFKKDLQRKMSGKKGTTPRLESDEPEIISGIFKGSTTGAPITILFQNTNIVSKDYSQFMDIPRPSHADFVAQQKYKQHNDFMGGGHFSGRLTLGLVAAGVLAKKIIHPVNVSAKVIEIGGSKNFNKILDKVITENDSIGGLIECITTNLPIGWGEPFFNSVESYISHLIFSIPATKGIEFGSGFAAANMKGSIHNDPIISSDGKTKTNNSGGINGGITNGNPLIFRVAIKPPSSISKEQKTFNLRSKKIEKLTVIGRHDVCIALRIPVIIEAITAIALCDLKLQYECYKCNN